MNQPTYLIVHCTGGIASNSLADTSMLTFGQVNEQHRQLWNFKSSLGFYIGYHYFIDKQGKVTQGRTDSDEGAHCIGKNLSSIGICLAGNFDVTLPTGEQTEALRDLLKQLKDKYQIKLENIVPHRAFSTKSCYGKKLANDWARKLVSENLVTWEQPNGYKITKYEIPTNTQIFLYYLKIYEALFKKQKPLGGAGERECGLLDINI